MELLFNATKHFKIKCYVSEQPLTLTYQVLLDKYKVHDRSLVYYHNAQESTATTTETNTIVPAKPKTNKRHQVSQADRYLCRQVLTLNSTTERSAVDTMLPIKYRADAQHMTLPAPNTTTKTISHCISIQEHPLLASQIQKTLNMMIQNTYKIKHHDTGKGVVTVPEDLQHLPTKHTQYPMTLQTHLTQKAAHKIRKKSDKLH